MILASASAIRAQLLRQAGVTFEQIPARVDEDAVKDSLRGETVERVPEALAQMKALRVSQSHPEALVLGADQILAFEGEIVSKSENPDQARALLRRLRGKEHQLIGGAVLAKGGQVIWRHLARSHLWLRDFSDDFLEDYLASEGQEALQSVGCYRLEGPGVQLFSRIDGDYFSILGLPLLAALREHGVVAR
ncbi:MAG TPA: nucleoside triphosphate pyrophosphatase [Rhizomicrobium sp.]|jgi:septum formation protein